MQTAAGFGCPEGRAALGERDVMLKQAGVHRLSSGGKPSTVENTPVSLPSDLRAQVPLTMMEKTAWSPCSLVLIPCCLLCTT